MPTLKSLLLLHLPSVLPSEPDRAVTGTSLIKLLKEAMGSVFDDRSEVSMSQYFSILSRDPGTCIAKRDGQHGYFLRQKTFSTQDTLKSTDGAMLEQQGESVAGTAGRGNQPEEKFRAVYRQLLHTNGSFTMQIEHTKDRTLRGEAGRNMWKYPDVVALYWAVDPEEEGGEATARFDADDLALKKASGEPIFQLTSVELKTDISLANAREHFFQCLSNSRWAHKAMLAVAAPINEATLAEELRRLGKAHGVGIVSYGVPADAWADLPSAEAILEMDIPEFESDVLPKLGGMIENIFSPGEENLELDWEYLRDMRTQNRDFVDLFKWIRFCLDNKKACSYESVMAVI